MSVGDYIIRSEYEARHAELRTEMIQLSNTMTTTTNPIRSDIQSRFDTLCF